MSRTFILLLLSLFSIILFYSCGEQASEEQNRTSQPVLLDTSQYTILVYDSTELWPFKTHVWVGQKVKQTTLATNEIAGVESLLKSCIDSQNFVKERVFDSLNKANPEYQLKRHAFVIDLDRYKRQFVPVITESGDKEVWVNGFCSIDKDYWRKEIVEVKDGGSCYFNLVINLSRGTCLQLEVNDAP